MLNHAVLVRERQLVVDVQLWHGLSPVVSDSGSLEERVGKLEEEDAY